jgi:hypothetical protein
MSQCSGAALPSGQQFQVEPIALYWRAVSTQESGATHLWAKSSLLNIGKLSHHLELSREFLVHDAVSLIWFLKLANQNQHIQLGTHLTSGADQDGDTE